MKTAFHRRPRFIVAVSAALYALALVFTWFAGTESALTRAREILEGAENGFSEVIYGEVDAVLKFTAGSVLAKLSGRETGASFEEMCALAEETNLDEINVVAAADGHVTASNIREVYGFDFRSNPLTAEFLALTNDDVSVVTQPFRSGVANPGMYCKYYGVAFPDRRHILQVGILFERLRRNMYNVTAEESARQLRNWNFSVEGWYMRGDEDPGFEPNRIFRRVEEGRPVFGRYFSFYDYPYAAIFPESVVFAERNKMVLATALVLGALMTLFTVFLLRLLSASDKLEAMHAAAEARTAEDLALARKIQMSALPSATGAFLERLEFSLEAVSRPAREVGGDFYDFYPVAGGRLAILVADVAGKGIPAAMFMMQAKNELKNCIAMFPDLEEAVAVANERLCANNEAEMFVTAWVGVLDLKTGETEYVNAGHNRPFVRHGDGSVEKVPGKGGVFLGMLEKQSYRAHRLTLRAGDRLFLYTDGITEAMNARKEVFGEARLVATLADRGSVESALKAHVGGAEQSDDLTALVLDWNGVPEPVRREFPCAESALAPAVEFLRSASAGLDRKALAALLNAADEITSNIVSYSGADVFTVTVERAPDRLRVTFADAGVAYNPLTHDDPDTAAPIEERPIGGLGLVMVKRLVDRVAYERLDGRNVLTLIKRTGN